MKEKTKIGIVGFGNMGKALSRQLTQTYQIFVFDKDKEKLKSAREIIVAESIAAVLDKVEAVVLAIKPQDFDTLLDEIKDQIKTKLIISIVAGITTSYIEDRLGNSRVIRVIPNLPAKIGQGMSCLSKGNFAVSEDLEFCQKLFGKLGQTLVVKEEMIDAATAISGSGPGYFYDFLESQGKDCLDLSEEKIKDFSLAFKQAAEAIGFSRSQADTLVEATVEGSLALLRDQSMSPSELKRQVASKGGTTEAGLKVLSQGGSLAEAVGAALIRAKELAKNE